MLKPNPEDFNLNEEKIKGIENLKSIFIIGIYVFWALCALAIVAYFFPRISWFVKNFFELSAYFVTAGIILILFSLLLSSKLIAEFFIGIFFGDYARYIQYVKDYGCWTLKTKTGFWYDLNDESLEREVLHLFSQEGRNPKLSSIRHQLKTVISLEDGTIIHCVSNRSPVGSEVAEELFDSLQILGVPKAILVSTGGFTTEVMKFVKEKPITLEGINQLIERTKAL